MAELSLLCTCNQNVPVPATTALSVYYSTLTHLSTCVSKNLSNHPSAYVSVHPSVTFNCNELRPSAHLKNYIRTPCHWASTSRRFEKTWCLRISGQADYFDSKDEGITPPKRRWLFTSRHGVISRKTWLFTNTTRQREVSQNTVKWTEFQLAIAVKAAHAHPTARHIQNHGTHGSLGAQVLQTYSFLLISRPCDNYTGQSTNKSNHAYELNKNR